jgi:hypothetical protein
MSEVPSLDFRGVLSVLQEWIGHEVGVALEVPDLPNVLRASGQLTAGGRMVGSGAVDDFGFKVGNAELTVQRAVFENAVRMEENLLSIVLRAPDFEASDDRVIAGGRVVIILELLDED